MSSSKLTLEVAAKTDKGRVRDGNEDNFLFTRNYVSGDWVLTKDEYPNSDAGTVMIVADGMGGLNAGEVASKIAVDSIKAYFGTLAGRIEESNIKSRLIGAVVNAHEQIVLHGKQHPETLGMGSTLILALISGDKMHLSWVGDSRCYLFRDGKLSQLSKDQSYVQTLIDKGEITREQAFFHPESNIITQSLGDADHVPKPDYASVAAQEKDIFILCSDGLNSMLMDADIERYVAATPGPPTCAEVLVQEANNAGGHDNITVIVAKVVSAEPFVLPVNGTLGTLTDSVVKKHPAVKKMQKGYRLLVLALAFGILAVVGYYKFGSRKSDPLESRETVVTASPKPAATKKDSVRAKAAAQHSPAPKKGSKNENVHEKSIQQLGSAPAGPVTKEKRKQGPLPDPNVLHPNSETPPNGELKPDILPKADSDSADRSGKPPKAETTGSKTENKRPNQQ